MSVDALMRRLEGTIKSAERLVRREIEVYLDEMALADIGHVGGMAAPNGKILYMLALHQRRGRVRHKPRESPRSRPPQELRGSWMTPHARSAPPRARQPRARPEIAAL